MIQQNWKSFSDLASIPYTLSSRILFFLLSIFFLFYILWMAQFVSILPSIEQKPMSRLHKHDVEKTKWFESQVSHIFRISMKIGISLLWVEWIIKNFRIRNSIGELQWNVWQQELNLNFMKTIGQISCMQVVWFGFTSGSTRIFFQKEPIKKSSNHGNLKMRMTCAIW